MSVYEMILIFLLAYYAFYLIFTAFIGIATESPNVHRRPYAFHRPVIYLLILALLLIDDIFAWFGEGFGFALFALLVADILYEMVRPFLHPSVEVSSASAEEIAGDLSGALRTLGIRYTGQYPEYNLVDQQARLEVKHWPSIGEAEIVIRPRSKMKLLLKIAQIVQDDFQLNRNKSQVREYVVNIVFAGIILGLVTWQYILGLKAVHPLTQ